MKETRVFILHWTYTDNEITSEVIQQWMQAEELPQKALDFITECEVNGEVYSLEYFTKELNEGGLEDLGLKWIFITNKY